MTISIKSRRIGGVFAAVILGLGLAACASPSGEEPAPSDGGPVPGGTLTSSIFSDITSLDPAACGQYALDRCAPIFGTLLRQDPETGDFTPYMAKSFESEDGQRWTLTLREGLEFSDGTPFDADAVDYNWKRLKDPATLSTAAGLLANWEWKVVDPLTVEVTLPAPNFQLPQALVFDVGMIGSPAAFESEGADFATRPVGAGPFVLDEWIQGSQQAMSKNPTYWEDGLPYLDNYVIKIIPADDQRLNALRAGEIDLEWSLNARDAETAESEGFNVDRAYLTGGSGIQVNLKDPVAGNDDFRQAVMHALDAQQIVDAVYPGSTVSTAFLAKASPFRDDSLGVYPAQDLEAAQAFFDDYLASNGKSAETVTFLGYAGIPLLEQVAQVVQAQLQEIEGLSVEIRAADAATVLSDQRAGNYQLTIGSNLSSGMDRIYDVFHTDGARNVSGYSNPVVDEAFEASRATADPAEIAKAYAVINGELSKNPVQRIYRETVGHLFSYDYVKGIQLYVSPTGAGTYVQGIWLDK